MGLQKCHECKKDVSSEAKLCPNCGAPVKKLTAIKKLTATDMKIIVGFFIFLLVFVFIAIMAGNETPITSPAGNQQQTPPPVKEGSQVATDAQIYRELEVCMNYAKKYENDDKLEFQRLSGNCILGLKKYNKKQAAKAFQEYFDYYSR